MPRTALLLAFAGCLATCAGDIAPPPEPAPPAEPPTPATLPIDAPKGLAENVGQPVHLEGRDLVIVAEGAQIRVAYLSADLVPVGGGEVVDLESPRSFEVRVDALELVIPEQTIEAALSARASGKKAPFKELKVRTEGDSLELDGRGGPLGMPFSFRAEPRLTAGGALALSLEKVRLLGIGVKGFLGAFPAAIENAANKKGHLVDIAGDQLVLNPFPFAGPPEVHAQFTSVELRKNEIVARLGALSHAEDKAGEQGLVFSGGTLRTKNLVLFGATMRLVAEKGGDLVIDPERVDAQLEGGFIKQHHDGSIEVDLAAP